MNISMEEAMKTMSMHRDMVQLVSKASPRNIEAITPKVVEYAKSLERNQAAVFWAVVHAVHTDNSRRLYRGSQEFKELILSIFVGNKVILPLINIPASDLVKMYQDSIA
jgi:hypothetical protein